MNLSDDLDEFYERIKREIDVESFLDLYASVNSFVVESGLAADRRIARRRLKRLRDEVQPVAHFVTHHLAPGSRVQFQLDSGPIDCTIWDSAQRCRLVQITVAQAKERFNLGRFLNKFGWAWGFLGVTDDGDKTAFDAAMDRGREMYSTEEAQTTIAKAVGICLKRKRNARGADTLLIDAPLDYLPPERWEAVTPQLIELAKDSDFTEVFITSRDLVLQIK